MVFGKLAEDEIKMPFRRQGIENSKIYRIFQKIEKLRKNNAVAIF